MTSEWLAGYRRIRLLSGRRRFAEDRLSTSSECCRQQESWPGPGDRPSRVWLVKDIQGSDYFVLKEISLTHRTDKQLEHIKNEHECLQHLSSEEIPGIVKLKASHTTDSTLYLLLELSVGGPLHRHIRRSGGLSVQTAKIYAAQLVEILGALHSLGYIYRDLKASNVTLDGSGCVTLVDLGFVKNLGTMSSRTYTYCGTYHALAPELHMISLGSGRLPSDNADREPLQGNADLSVTSSATSTGRQEEGRQSPWQCDETNKKAPAWPKGCHKHIEEPLSHDGNPSLADQGYGFAVDWWTLGILTYEMIANAPPYGYQDFDHGRRATVCSLALSSPQHLGVNYIEALDDSGRDFIKQLLQV
eukprot:GHVS01063246.1.p1 GENE.GHVS01063246.1~~GHVS01063246.1.p1  ORF type:complete len:359 (+),score=18.26 GHVS01063246.1:132-1208(+)